jgi:hypothetical protein
MKKVLAGAIASSFLVVAAYAGVSSIDNAGTSASGKSMYKVTCTNGNSYRIYKSSGEWYEASLGAIGGNYRSLQEEAKVVCK